ncbi:class I SAM-dependent methyltransferase [Candidatus Woesearchaeota archaeon]|nr:class I SAM-dependent methyltransferase [Candidatus Woesearchaeota archaeon]
MIKKLEQVISQIFFPTRRACNRLIKSLSRNINNKTILEIGSGKKIKGRYLYSYELYFNSSNRFIRSDINPEFGHKIIDITKMNEKNKYDIIICLNVLEHVYEFKKAVKNLHTALKKRRNFSIFLPVYIPSSRHP